MKRVKRLRFIKGFRVGVNFVVYGTIWFMDYGVYIGWSRVSGIFEVLGVGFRVKGFRFWILDLGQGV
jgi:hypothetical protein